MLAEERNHTEPEPTTPNESTTFKDFPDIVKEQQTTVHRVGNLIPAAFAISFYLAVGPSLILLNSSLLKGYGFHFPIMLSSLGLLCSGLLAHALVLLGIVPRPNLLGWRELLTGVLPVGLCQAGALYFGNRAYLHLSVSLIQLMKSITPVQTLAFSVAFGLARVNSGILTAIAVMCAGTVWGSTHSESPEWSVFGIGLCLLSGTCEAIRLVVTQKLFQSRKLTVVEGMYYLTPVSFFWMFVLAVWLELDGFTSGAAIMAAHPAHFLGAALLGVCVNVAGFFVVKTTSALTLKVAGSVRNIILVIVSSTFFGDIVNGQQFTGTMMSVTGILLYNYEKLRLKRLAVEDTSREESAV